MKMINKIALGAAAMVVASAASFPSQLSDLYRGTFPNDMRKREALDACAAQSASFIRFLASDRADCYRQLRSVGIASNYSGSWSKPDRAHPQLAQD